MNKQSQAQCKANTDPEFYKTGKFNNNMAYFNWAPDNPDIQQKYKKMCMISFTISGKYSRQNRACGNAEAVLATLR